MADTGPMSRGEASKGLSLKCFKVYSPHPHTTPVCESTVTFMKLSPTTFTKHLLTLPLNIRSFIHSLGTKLIMLEMPSETQHLQVIGPTSKAGSRQEPVS